MTARRWMGILGMALLGAGGLAPMTLFASADGYTMADIKLKSAGNLVDICTVDPTNEAYPATLGFCYGFFEGAIRYHEAIAGATSVKDLVCVPEGTTRKQAVDVFISYMQEHPEYQAEGSIDAIFRALMARWPCAAPK
jgi:Rap1a immunity proteins